MGDTTLNKLIHLAAVCAPLVLGTGVACAAETAASNRPNLLFLLADDLRWDAVGFAGNPFVRTPHLDRLASRGVQFTNSFVTTPICAVSRASIFSGQHERRHGVDDFAKTFSGDGWRQTYPALLREHGYRTGFIGKFGVGKSAAATNHFDYWRGFDGQGQYFPKGGTNHLTTMMADQAREFLRGNPAGKPFCLSVSFKAPHAQDGAKREFPPDPRDEPLYADVTVPVPRMATDAAYSALPPGARDSEGRVRWQRRFSSPELFQQTTRDYHRLVAGMDREIGRILAELEELKLAGNTVVIFSSDNGFFLGERGMADKWLMYEESIRVPLVILDPRTPSDRRGTRPGAMALNIDIAPTLLDYAGVPAPGSMQGRSLRPLTEGRQVAWRTEGFFEHHYDHKGRIPQSEAVRTGRWKYIRWLSTGPVKEELYDLEMDPLEERDLAGEPARAAKLKELRTRWEALGGELK